MKAVLHKSSLIKKTIQVGGVTFISRMLGLLREVMTARYLGATLIADAFITAFKIPNSLRKIFAEGALSAAFVPVVVKAQLEDDTKAINSIMTLAFLIFEGLLILLCVLIFFKAESVIRFIAPGWYSYHLPGLVSHDISGHIDRFFYTIKIFLYPAYYGVQAGPQVAYAVTFLRILISFILFISSSALLTGALHSINHFFVPAFAPVLFNIVYISGLVMSIYYGLSVQQFCWFVLAAGLAQFFIHIFVYFYLGFGFGSITKKSWSAMRLVLIKFFPCVVSMSAMEISLFVDTSLASYLPTGSMMQIYLSNRFVGIPLGVFATAFSTILLPHFSRVTVRAPERMSFYLLEAVKLVFWVTLPVTIFLVWWAKPIFITLFLSPKFPYDKIIGASYVLIAFSLGLFFFSINKILLSIYYAFHETRIPTIITLLATLLNIILNLLLLHSMQATGLALATSFAAMVQTILFIYFLRKKCGVIFYTNRFMLFVRSYLNQIIVIGGLVASFYYFCLYLISRLPYSLSILLLQKIWFWFWAGPLACGALLLLYLTRKQFGVRLFFVD
ncbi:MAG TPA: murein biosynthesis integral membrane protein MurJ [Candidatus Babeliales bacterium]|nr:murein biosynthesis integral membrane protein MurJ [Candidatus Babeliales bacterium]